MKFDVEADTSKFSKGMKQAKADLRDLEKTSSASLGKLGDIVGVDTQKLDQMAGALRGLGSKMQEAGGAGTQAFGKMLSSISSATTAIAGLGIGAAVAGFKLLSAEADNFKSTVQGANLELMTAAYVDTYRQVLHDMNSATGESMATLGEKLKRTWTQFTAGAGQGFLNSLNNPSFNVGSLFGPVGQMLGSMGLVGGKLSEQMAQANAQGEKAAAIANRLYEIERQRSDQTRVIARLDAEISEAKYIAYNTTYSIAERQAAIAKAQELINQKYALQLPLEKEAAELMDQMNSLASSTPAQIDAANRQATVSLTLEKQQKNELRELLERQKSIADAAAKEAAARQASLEASRQIQQQRAELAGLDLSVSPEARNMLNSVQATFQDMGGIAIPIKPDEQSLIDFSMFVESTLSDSFSVIGESLGNLIGDLATGGDAWTNFTNTALSAFGDMAVSVGKMAIATGTATLGIEAALKSLNGYAAIAAGVALVALGSAVKTGLSNIAGGNYSAYSGVATSQSAVMTSGDFNTRSIDVQVSGTLEADGNKIVAVIEQTNKRNKYTT